MSEPGASADPGRVRVLTEIGEEVLRRRQNGELLPGFERQLDEAFAELTPPAGSFGGVLEVADRSSYVDIEVPVRSNLPAGGVVKRVLRRLMSWYLDYVVQQVNRFTAATTRVAHLVDDRLTHLEREAGDRHAAARLAPPLDPQPWADLVGSAVADAPGEGPAPILHASCADGRLLAALRDRGVPSYGVDPRSELLDQAAATGVDVRRAQPWEHLQRLEDGSLGGVVLSGFVDLLAVPAHCRLVELAGCKLRRGGVLVLLGTDPEAWTRAAPVTVRDLSPGRPLHAETWAHLLTEAGFERVEVHDGSGDERADRPAAGRPGEHPSTYAVVGVRGR